MQCLLAHSIALSYAASTKCVKEGSGNAKPFSTARTKGRCMMVERWAQVQLCSHQWLQTMLMLLLLCWVLLQSMARSSIESKATLVDPEPLPVHPEMAALSQQQAAYLYYYSYYYPTVSAQAQTQAPPAAAAPPSPGDAAPPAAQQQAQAIPAPAQTAPAASTI